MPRLLFTQQLALLPVTVPEYILDFLEGIESPDPFAMESFRASMTADYLVASKGHVETALADLKVSLQGKISSVQVEPLADVAHTYVCKLVSEGATRCVVFGMKSRVGNIVKLAFLEGDVSLEEIKKLVG